MRALVGGADGEVEHLPGEGIEGSGSHDLFDAFPSAAQSGEIEGQGFPEIVDPVGVASGHDVVIDGAHFGRGIGVFEESEGGHADQNSAPGWNRCDLRLISKARFVFRH